MCAYGKYFAEQDLEDGVNSDLYICGMQPVEEGRPCHEIFYCEPELLCSTPVESDFYNVKQSFMAPSDFVRDPLMCSICASTSHDTEGGQVDAELKTVYAVVLTICATCKSE